MTAQRITAALIAAAAAARRIQGRAADAVRNGDLTGWLAIALLFYGMVSSVGAVAGLAGEDWASLLSSAWLLLCGLVLLRGGGR
jgi:hypothetical protein